MKYIITGIIGWLIARIFYRRHITIAQSIISADLAYRWVEHMNIDNQILF